MDGAPPAQDGERRREARDGRPRAALRLPSITIAAILAAAAVAVIAVLQGWRGVPNTGTKPVGGHEPILARIDYEKLLRMVGPYMPLYQQGLPPFHNLNPVRGQTNLGRRRAEAPRTEEVLLSLADLPSVQIKPVPAEDRKTGVYATVGKVTWTSPKIKMECTGVMVSPSHMVTADHCLPWDEPSPVWTSIKFTPAYDESGNPQEPNGEANVVRCMGINPPMEDGTDMAACELDWPIGNKSGYVKYSWPVIGSDGYDPVQWYKDREWYSIGYASSQSPSVAGIFDIDEVAPDPDYGYNVLTTGYFANPGWSGGPAFSQQTVDGNPFHVIFGAVATECVAPMPNCGSGARGEKTILAGGMRIGALVTLGLMKWDNNSWGFDKSPE